MSFTILSHFTQGIDNFFAEFRTFHNRLNLNENVKEANGRIDYLSGLASDQQADIVDQHFSQLLWKYISKFLKKNWQKFTHMQILVFLGKENTYVINSWNGFERAMNHCWAAR